MKKETAAKTVGAKAKEPNPRDAKVRTLRDSDPKKWTWVKLDLHFWKKETHGGNSFTAYKREVARLKAAKRVTKNSAPTEA